MTKRCFFLARQFEAADQRVFVLMELWLTAIPLGRAGHSLIGEACPRGLVHLSGDRGQLLWPGPLPPNWPTMLRSAARAGRIPPAKPGKPRKEKQRGKNQWGWHGCDN